MEHTRNIFFDKVNKAQLINKMRVEEEVTLDGQTWYHIKYDNTAPKTAFLFTYLPYNMDQAWTYEVRQHRPQDCLPLHLPSLQHGPGLDLRGRQGAHRQRWLHPDPQDHPRSEHHPGGRVGLRCQGQRWIQVRDGAPSQDDHD